MTEVVSTHKVEHRAPASGAPPEWLVVLLHGLGSNGADMIAFADYWTKALPDAAFVAPDAPTPCPDAEGGFQWISKRPPGDPRMLGEVEEAAPAIDAFVDAELAAAGLPPDRLALVGFSQGAVMALHVGLRRAVAPAAVLAYSGGLVGAERLPDEITARPPVMLIHGEQDPVAPIYAMHVAVWALEELGVAVHGHAVPKLDHAVNADALILGGRFLLSAFAYRQRHAPAPDG